ncbi:MAG: CBS domain-containing protein [Streptosporangiaceae bacterium]|nr:CBS domain-containing protein [Streptosporangiaceae bacterium]
MAKKIRDVMTPAPVCVAPAESVSAAARAMGEHGIGTVMVCDGDRLLGLVTDRDIAIRVLAENRDPAVTQIADIASEELATLSPDDDVSEAVRLVRERAVRRIPVVSDGRPVGIVSIGDIALDRDSGSALADVSAAPPNT